MLIPVIVTVIGKKSVFKEQLLHGGSCDNIIFPLCLRGNNGPARKEN